MKIGKDLNNTQYIDQENCLESYFKDQSCLFCGSLELDFFNLIDTKGHLDSVIYQVYELNFDCKHINPYYLNLNETLLTETYLLPKVDLEDFLNSKVMECEECWQLLVLKYYLAMSLQDFNQATESALILLDKFSEDPLSYIYLANVALKNLDFEKYEDYYFKASELEPVLDQIELLDTVLDQKDFVLGKLFVAQDNKQRRLFINQQNQGGLLLNKLSSKENNLSTIPESFCSIMFYPAAQLFCDGRLLMLGLGSGSGVIALLTEFTNLRIDVVEKYQEVIDLSLKHFHYLNDFISQGRLQIICDDGLEYINEYSQSNEFIQYDAICLDMYSGDQEISFSLEPSSLVSLSCVGKSVWMNYIGNIQTLNFKTLLQKFKESMIEFCVYSSTVSGFESFNSTNNILLSTVDFNSDLELKAGPSKLLVDINENLRQLGNNKVSYSQ
ncbi:MAG: hypothetical protein KC646_04015 [Candidatus Cloacimonetes bacterium]|nr:hypothetical protein [Candidatus Cloacimonadota bacterium]